MKYRYFIELQYKGTLYHGWQMQPNAPTIQKELNEKLGILLDRTIETVGAGRTDSGVHARHFIAHFDSEKDLSGHESKLCYKLNSFLPHDIAILRIAPVSSNAHARFDAISRTYSYYIATQKDVFLKNYSWLLKYKLDIDLMNTGAKLLQDYTDFTSFSKLHSDVKTNICHVKSCYWSKNENQLIFSITADRFLRNMVRAIVGTLVQVGRKKININKLAEILESKDRSQAGESAPAKGLFLDKIEYPYPY